MPPFSIPLLLSFFVVAFFFFISFSKQPLRKSQRGFIVRRVQGNVHEGCQGVSCRGLKRLELSSYRVLHIKISENFIRYLKKIFSCFKRHFALFHLLLTAWLLLTATAHSCRTLHHIIFVVSFYVPERIMCTQCSMSISDTTDFMVSFLTTFSY